MSLSARLPVVEDIEAFVVNKTKAEIAGSGSVKYKGDPQDIQKKVMGSGKIEKVE